MSRRQRARREAVVGATAGALTGFALWHWFGEHPVELVAWAGGLAFVFAVIFHHNEYMCG